jgi:altronate hydrolase
MMRGWQRADGRKGIRNVIVIAYLVECAHHVSRQIAVGFPDEDVHVIGFPGCYPNPYAERMMTELCTHPNVGAVLLVSLGCESFNRGALASVIEQSGRPVETLIIQQTGGSAKSVAAGRAWLQQTAPILHAQQPVAMHPSELTVGTICGGSDGTSGLTANPAMGRAFDLLIEEGAACIFEEAGELIGCEALMTERSARPQLAREIQRAMEKTVRYYATLGYASISPGNAEGGLTTIEEKSMGAYAKSGASEIVGLLKPGDRPSSGGLYFLDVVPDGEVRFGFPNISDNAEIAELIACGAHLVLFSTGRGSVVGSAISPIIKVCANPETYRCMADDMDVDSGRILEGRGNLDDVGKEIRDIVVAVAGGHQTRSEALGHREFILTYKAFEPLGPSCLPAA